MSGECTPKEYQRSLLHDGTILCLTKGSTIGLVVIVEAAFVSLVAISWLFAIIIKNSIWRRRHIREAMFHQPNDLLMIALLVALLLADVIQAIGMILNLRWITLGKVELGTFCTAQGIIKTFGVSGVALFTLVIAIYTLLSVWTGRNVASLRIAVGVVMAIWLFDAVFAMMGPLVNRGEGKPSYMSVTPYSTWCSTRKDNYLGWKILNDVWRWVALFGSILTYLPLWLWVRGNLVIEDPHRQWWRLSFVWAPEYDANLRGRRTRSLIMLAYPLTYCTLVLPLTVVRWMNWWVPSQVPLAATFATESAFGLSGFFNVILLVTTRPGLFGQLPPAGPPSITESEDQVDQREMAGDGHMLERLTPC